MTLKIHDLVLKEFLTKPLNGRLLRGSDKYLQLRNTTQQIQEI